MILNSIDGAVTNFDQLLRQLTHSIHSLEQQPSPNSHLHKSCHFHPGFRKRQGSQRGIEVDLNTGRRVWCVACLSTNIPHHGW